MPLICWVKYVTKNWAEHKHLDYLVTSSTVYTGMGNQLIKVDIDSCDPRFRPLFSSFPQLDNCVATF